MIEISQSGRQTRLIIIIAIVFFSMGLLTGLNLHPDTTPYQPVPITAPESEREFDVTLFAILGGIGAAMIIMIGGFILLRRHPEGLQVYQELNRNSNRS